LGDARVAGVQEESRLVPGEGLSTPSTSSEPGATAAAVPLAPAAGDAALQVNGAAVVTTATFGGAVAAIDRECPGALGSGNRYTDCGNGTVRDNNTGLFWLKDASCGGLAGTDTFGRGNWATAEAAAAALASGTCGLTDGSSAGDWRQPTASEFCSAWSGAILNPCPLGAASDSLIDSSAGPPTIAAGHPFLGVQSSFYWSATELNALTAWIARLSDGLVSIGSKDGLNYVWPVRN
jgi:hypothetical protein